jgi:hypothetical protein
MAVTEQPVDIVSTRTVYGTLGTFVLGDHTKRVNWINSFYVPTDAHVQYLTNFSDPSPPFIGYGAVQDSKGTTHDQIGYENQGTVTTFQQIYISEVKPVPAMTWVGGQIVQTSSLNPTFPGGSLPLAVVVLDGVQRVQQVIDFRPSYLLAAPNLGSGMTESVADATKRVYFQNNYAVPRIYALSPQIPADLAIPAPGFFLGSGAVVISGITHTTPTTYFFTSVKGGQLASNVINQGYVDPTSGAVTIRQVQTSGTFPANSLALFECTTDAVGLVRNLVDWRPSYI